MLILAYRHRWSAPGFTLIELLVTLAVAAIVITVAAPGFSDFLRRNQATAVVNDFVYALRLARSEAVTEGYAMGVCQSADSQSCGGGNDWHSGWLVFEDPDADGMCTDSDNDGNCDPETILLAHRPDAQGFTFSSNNSQASNGTITYTSNGYLDGVQNGTFSLCSQELENRGIVLSRSGRVRSADAGEPDCSS